VITGGVTKITKFTTVVLPFMTVFYIVFCFGVILKNITLLDDAFLSIFKGAFSPKAVTGGAVGSFYTVIITGAQKGIFSNEAGLGTAGMAHAVAEDSNIKTQGLFGVFEVFVDTVVICSLTALTILCSGVIISYNEPASSDLVSQALATLYGGFAKPALAIMLLLFGVSSVIGWAAYGISCSDYIAGKFGKKIFVFLYPVFCILGAVLNTQTAWRLAEFFNGIMLTINLFAVLTLSKKAVTILKE
jgi:AGCS family alanine or glycine:cation symporter